MSRTELNISSVSATQFAPSVEVLTINFDPANPRRFDEYVLEVTDNQNRVVYRAVQALLMDGTLWDGRGDVAAPDNPRPFVSPLGSPYTLRLYGQNRRMGQTLPAPFAAFLRTTGETKDTLTSIVRRKVGWIPAVTTHRVNVLFHSVALELGDWLPAAELARLDQIVGADQGNGFANLDPNNADVIKWVWSRLGQLGYFPGPQVTTRTADDLLGKAIRRYRQADGDLYTRLVELGPDGDGRLIAAALTATQAIDAALLTKLWNRANARLDPAHPGSMDVLSAPGVIKNNPAASKLFVDVDRFYVGYAQEFERNRHTAVDRAWTPRPQIPLEARIFLEDSNGQAVAVRHATALGDYRVKWTWTDRAENVSGLPVHTPTQPSRTQEYINAAHTAAANAVNSTYHNARAAVGGLITGNAAADAGCVFGAVDGIVHQAVNDGVLTGGPSRPELLADSGLASATRTYFQPSNLGGDNYTITAELDQSGWDPQVVTSHASRATRLRKQTGEFEIWRRVRIAAYVQWGAVNAVTNWAPIRAHLEKAYLTITDPVASTTLAAMTGTARQHFENAVNQAFQSTNAVQLANVRNAPARAQYFAQFSQNHALGEDPHTLEYQDLHAFGVAQFAHPANIVNELMVGLLRYDLMRWREDEVPGSTKKPTAKGFVGRLKAAVLWQGCANWVQSVGNHFQPELARLVQQNTLVNEPCPANRRIAPINRSALTAAPATRDEILNGLLLDPALSGLTNWLNGAALQPAEQTTLNTLVNILKTFNDDIESLDRNKYPVHGAIRRAVRHCWELFAERFGKVTGTTTLSCALKAHHLEVCVENSDLATVRPLLRTHNLTEASATAVRGTPWTILNLTINGTVSSYNLNALQTAPLPAGAILTNIRGPGATIPRFALPPAEDQRLDEDFRRALLDLEKTAVLQRLASVYTMFNATCWALDDAVHGLSPRPPGGLILCHYAAHPRPLTIETGVAGADIMDFTNSTSIGVDGVAWLSNDQPLPQDHLFAHEAAHCLFLRHWQKGEEAIADGFSNPTDHDLADNNCIMSYPAYERSTCHTHYASNTYRPHFCGKCNLKLRGWDIGAAFVPASSRQLTPVFPNVSGLTVTSTDIPDPADVHVELQQMAADLGVTLTVRRGGSAYAPSPTNLRYYAGTNLQVINGVSTFVRQPQVVTGRPSGAPFGPTSEPWHHDTLAGVTAIRDADLLRVPNAAYHAAWEENLDQLIAQGGKTDAPTAILFSMPTPRYYTCDTIFHEMIHFYQAWDGSNIQEGITDFLACMLSLRFLRRHPTAAHVATYHFNPSYLHVMQFAVDQFLPRLGIRGLAKLYFEGASDGLNAWLRAGVKAGDFHERLCKPGIDAYDISAAAAALRPIDSRPPTTRAPAPPHQVDQDAATALNKVAQYIQSNLPPNGVLPNDREQNVVLIRLKTKIEVFRDALTQAKGFRNQVTDTNRVHRLERYIEDTVAAIATMKDIYVRKGGSRGDVDNPNDHG